MSRPRRLPHFEYRGSYRYLLTFCTLRRRETFRDEANARMVVAHLRRTSRETGFAVLAYCVMPDHVHALVEGITATADLRTFVKRLKQRTGQVYAHGSGRPLWQEGYFERVLRRDEDAKAVARYILENPVRAALASSAADYAHVGSDVWTVAELIASMDA